MSVVPYKKSVRTVPLYNNGFDQIDRLFSNMFDNALSNMKVNEGRLTDLNIALKIKENNKAYIIIAELPGLTEKEIEVTINDGVLSISGEKKEADTPREDETIHRTEIRYGSFKRSLTLPSDADENKITATMKHGILSLEIKKLKTEEKKAKRITVKAE